MNIKPSMRMARGFLALALLGVASFALSDPISWYQATADLRFEMSISNRPKEAIAGIIAVVPDRGILPRSKFRPEVVDPAGKLLKSETLWHNPNEGLALVFEVPETETVFIYMIPSSEGHRFVSSFRPSLLLYVRNGNASLEQARTLADNPPVGNDIYFAVVDRIYHSILPVGRDDNTASYYAGWFSSPKPGKTYFYTLSQDGSEFLIDGKLVHSWPGRHDRAEGKNGEHGNWVNITPGLHKLDYFHYAIERPGRESQLGWQFPGTAPGDDPKASGKKKPNAGPMEAEYFVHSGMATLVRATSRKGPVAIFTFRWESIINPFQEPIGLFRFRGFGDDPPPAGTTYEWDFGNHQKVMGQEAVWLYAGNGNQKVTLTVSSGKQASKCTHLFFPKSLDPNNDPPLLFVSNVKTRLLYSKVFLDMCRAVSAGPVRPCESWSESLWQGLLAVADSPLTIPLLTEIFERSRPDILKLPLTLRWPLEDVFFEALCRTNQATAFAWLDRFEKEERDAARIGHWQAARVECYLYDVNDLKAARGAAVKFMAAAATPIQSALALIRMGDVERLSNNLEEARRLYGLAQQARQNLAPAPPSPAAALSNADSRLRTAKLTNSAIRNSQSATNAPARTRRPISYPAPPASIQDWKISAVHEAAYYATVQSLIQQQALAEARQSLDQWELELPLSKLSGDYPLAEARYYMALQRYQQALKILSSYRESVDLTNYLPEAMKLEFQCLALLQRHDAALELARLIVKRLPNHPLAEEAKLQLSPENQRQLTLGKDNQHKDWTSSEKVKPGILVDALGSNKTLQIKAKPINNGP